MFNCEPPGYASEWKETRLYDILNHLLTWEKVHVLRVKLDNSADLPRSQSWPLNPAGHTQRYPLLVKPD